MPSVEAAAAAKGEAGAPILGPGAVPVNLRINGEVLSARLEPRVTLLDALRTRFELTGAKRVCDRGTCGACTVLMDGKTVYACSILAIDAQDAEIQTVESIGSVEKLHPLQTVFVENDAQQCGFCIPGFVVAARGLLDRNPNPSPDEIQHGLSGNFCRCGTYPNIRRAVLQIAQRGSSVAGEEEPLPELSDPAIDPVGKVRPERQKKKKKKKPKKGGRGGGL
jgi:xanthine dehydrogenase YagT iron-sulfur-binding subunit